MVHDPYRGSGPAINDTIAGQVAAQFDNLSSSLSFIQSGMLHALAVASPQRVPELPNVPTYAELGLAELNNMARFGLVAPAHTSNEVCSKLNEATVAAMKTRRFFRGPRPPAHRRMQVRPAQFASRTAKELEMRKRIAAQQHIVLE